MVYNGPLRWKDDMVCYEKVPRRREEVEKWLCITVDRDSDREKV